MRFVSGSYFTINIDIYSGPINLHNQATLTKSIALIALSIYLMEHRVCVAPKLHSEVSEKKVPTAVANSTHARNHKQMLLDVIFSRYFFIVSHPQVG